MVHLGRQTRPAVLAHHALVEAQRFFGVHDFHYYAIADGIREILSKRRSPPFEFRRRAPEDPPRPDLFGFT